jgi:hypothetical protein
MEVHSFRTQHAFVDRMILISLYFDIAVFVFVDNDTATHSTIRTCCFE